jgi:hypothetical protein
MVEKRNTIDEDAVTDSDAGEGTDDDSDINNNNDDEGDDASSTHSEDNQHRDKDGNNTEAGGLGKGTRGMDAKMKTWNRYEPINSNCLESTINGRASGKDSILKSNREVHHS